MSFIPDDPRITSLRVEAAGLARWIYRLGSVLAVACLVACREPAAVLSPESTGEPLPACPATDPPPTPDGTTAAPLPSPTPRAYCPTCGISDVQSTQLAQSRDVEFEHISVEQGLSQSTVHCILQDSQGFMWFGTEDGLNKYDGYQFTVYRNDPSDPDSLSHNVVKAIFEDRSGDLWIGTDGGGLDRFDRRSEVFTHYTHDPYDSNSLSYDAVTSLYQDRSGVLWVGTWVGLDEFDVEENAFYRYRPRRRSRNTVNVIYGDQSGDLWIGTSVGLARFNRQTRKFRSYQNISYDPTSLSNDVVQSIHQDREGILWIGTDGGGLNRFDPANERFTHYLIDPVGQAGLVYNSVVAVYEDQFGVLWVGTDGGGLYHFDRQRERFIAYRTDPNNASSLSSNYVRSIYEDRQGVLWVGTWDGGVNKYDREKRFTLYQNDPYDENSLSHNHVLSLLQDRDGILWIGTDGQGLDRFDRRRNEFTHFQNEPGVNHSLSNNTVIALHEDREGVLWVGTWGGGLNRFDRETGRFTHYKHDPGDSGSLGGNIVRAIHEDRQGTLWIGTLGGGLNRFIQGREQFARYVHKPYDPYSLKDNYVTAIAEDRDGALWLGTWGGGLERFDPKSERFDHYQTDRAGPLSPEGKVILTVHEDVNGGLWIGTDGGGLNCLYPEERRIVHYGRAQGLPSDTVSSILEDDAGFLWLSTRKGLSRFNPCTQTFKNYGVSDGLQGYEFSQAHHKGVDGEMFVGGVNGFNAFYPHTIVDNPYVPPVVLTRLTQGGEDVSVGLAAEEIEQVTFRWPNNFFEFEFAALNYVQPQENQYAYMLEGFDAGWDYVGTRRFGQYTNLPGQTYTLRIRGSNNDGVWNQDGVSIEVTIVPPFWETWWFRGGLVLTLLVVAVGGIRARVKSVEMRNRELAGQVEQRTAELSRANRALKREIAERRRAEQALAHQAAETAVAAERSRLARDLHDAVTQTLFSASLIAEALPHIWEGDRVEGRQLLAEMRRLSRGALAEMRTLLLELRPTALVEASLGDLLNQLAEAAAGREDISISVIADETSHLSPDVHVALYRIAQEALNNVVKHAHADRAEVELRCYPLLPRQGGDGQDHPVVELHIADDGCGFDPARVASDHLGLDIMQERAQVIGAELCIESQPGQGTEVKVVWQGEKGQRR